MVDPVTDKGFRQLSEIASVFGLPGFVKSARVEHWGGLKAAAYAGPGTFPVGTKAATWLSCAYYLLNKEQLKPGVVRVIEHRLRKAAQLHGIDYDALEKEATAAETSVEIPYALEAEFQGKTVRLCPIPDADSVRKAADYVFDNRDKLPYVWRQKIARTLLESAERFQITPPHRGYLLKAAGRGVADQAEVAGNFMLRAAVVHDPEAKRLLREHAGACVNAQFDLDWLRKNAGLLATVDETFGLTPLYKKGLLAPEESLFRHTIDDMQKLAARCIKLANGKLLTDDQLLAAPLRPIASLIGGEFAKVVNRSFSPDLAAVKSAAAGLDARTADVLCRVLPDVGSPMEGWGFLAQ